MVADAVGMPDETNDGGVDPSGFGRVVIDAEALDLTFDTADGRVNALANVNLRVREGEFVSFIGPSGCGKTTLLRVIADLEQATGGRITVGGVSPADARASRLYGYVFQAPALLPWRSVFANVTLPLEIFGVPKAERVARAMPISSSST